MKPRISPESMFNEAYDAYAAPLYKYCMSRLQCREDDALDCLQDSFVVYFTKLRQGEIINNPQAFLFKTATNFIHKQYEKASKEQKRQKSLDSLDLLCDAGALNEITDRIDFELFENRLNEILTEDEKNLYELRFKRELKAKEIAERLGITVSHCTVNISRLRKKIIKNLYDFR